MLYASYDQNPSDPSSIELCLPTATNNQYTIKLLPSSGNSWPDGSYVTLYGKYGNVVFKNFLSGTIAESYTLSLYYGIEQNASWKMTSGSITTGDFWIDYYWLDFLFIL